MPQDLSVWRGRFNQEPASSPPEALCSALASPRRGHTPPTRPRRPPAAPHRTLCGRSAPRPPSCKVERHCHLVAVAGTASPA